MTTDQSFIFCKRDLMLSSFREFEDMRRKNELIDFEIILKNRCFKGHRLVLAAAVPYFRKTQSTEIDGVRPDALEYIINFAYSGTIEISSENVRSLISATKFFDLKEVYDACCKFLEGRIHVNNVWEIRTFAESNHFSELILVTDRYINENFEAFVKSESFNDLTFQILKEIVSRDDLKVTTEEEVFEAVMRWIKLSPIQRRNHLPDLLTAVRMSQLTPDYMLERVSREDLVQTCKSCRELVEKAKLYHSVPEKASGNCSFAMRPRTTQATKCEDNTFGLYGISDSESGISVKFLNTDSQKWTNLSASEIKHLQCVVSVGARIYVFLENTINFFQVKTLEWNLLRTSHEILHVSGTVCHKKNIYFFGGPEKFSNVVRCFSPDKNAWLEEDEMTSDLECPAAASFENFIYVTGGNLQGTIYKTVGRYNSETKKWEEVSSMLSERSGHGCTSLNGKIYVCGGSNQNEYLSTMEMYDPGTNHWKFVCSMKAPRAAFSIVPYDGKIYVLGGLTEGYVAAIEMEVYCPDDDKWRSGISLHNKKSSEIFLVKAEVCTTINQKKLTGESSSTKKQFRLSCNYCLKLGHPDEYCWYKNKICFICGEPGHFAIDCAQKDRKTKKCSQCGRYGPCIHKPTFTEIDLKCCFSCGDKGHFAHNCTSSSGNNRISDSSVEPGHFEDE